MSIYASGPDRARAIGPANDTLPHAADAAADRPAGFPAVIFWALYPFFLLAVLAALFGLDRLVAICMGTA